MTPVLSKEFLNLLFDNPEERNMNLSHQSPVDVEDNERKFREIESNKRKKFSIFKKDKENMQTKQTDDEVFSPDDFVQRQKSFSRSISRSEKNNFLVRSKSIKNLKKKKKIQTIGMIMG